MATYEEAKATAYQFLIGEASFGLALIRRPGSLPWIVTAPGVSAHNLSSSAIEDAQIEASAYLLSQGVKVITNWAYSGDTDYGSRAVCV